MVVIIDYKCGNLLSIKNMLGRIGVEALITSNPDILKNATKIILPGVGHFKSGMEQLQSLGWVGAIQEEVVNKGKPILGICLGMQLFTEFSEEGNCSGLALVPGKTMRFQPVNSQMKIPHMGWAKLATKPREPLFDGEDADARYYFVHAYHVHNIPDDYVIATTNYGYPFVSAIRRNHIWGVQFHPEKSHRFGMHLLENFVKS